MSYATQDDLLQRMTMQELVQLTDDTKPASTVNDTVVQGELDEGSAQIDSYCRARYTVPLQGSVDVLRINRDISVYGLYSRRPQQKMPETVRQRYVDAIALLKDVSSGKASLDQQLDAPPQVSGASGQLPSCNHERFTNHHLEGFC